MPWLKSGKFSYPVRTTDQRGSEHSCGAISDLCKCKCLTLPSCRPEASLRKRRSFRREAVERGAPISERSRPSEKFAKYTCDTGAVLTRADEIDIRTVDCRTPYSEWLQLGSNQSRLYAHGSQCETPCTYCAHGSMIKDKPSQGRVRRPFKCGTFACDEGNTEMSLVSEILNNMGLAW